MLTQIRIRASDSMPIQTLSMLFIRPTSFKGTLLVWACHLLQKYISSSRKEEMYVDLNDQFIQFLQIMAILFHFFILGMKSSMMNGGLTATLFSDFSTILCQFVYYIFLVHEKYHCHLHKKRQYYCLHTRTGYTHLNTWTLSLSSFARMYDEKMGKVQKTIIKCVHSAQTC